MVTNRHSDGGFVLACRALAVIAAVPSAVMTSANIADRIGAHPVVLRRVLAQLRSAGLVEGRSVLAVAGRLRGIPTSWDWVGFDEP